MMNMCRLLMNGTATTQQVLSVKLQINLFIVKHLFPLDTAEVRHGFLA
jgi:hypothetical protein